MQENRSMKKLLESVVAAAMVAAFTPAAPAADATASAAAAKEQAGVGAPAPQWKNLAGVDDKAHNLSDLKDAKAVAVVFTCNHCPVAKAYEDRLVELAADYDDKGVEVVAINVSNADADKLPAMKERAEEKGFKFAYLYDPSQQIGREFGAAKTPHAFLLDGDRNIAYIGAIDDNMMPEKVTNHYLRDAIDAVLAGQQPATSTTAAIGCGIRYE
jgi:thiol-disulfide isomerase/thioredoxin